MIAPFASPVKTDFATFPHKLIKMMWRKRAESANQLCLIVML